MNFIPKQQTLENISLAKIAALLWNKHDIRVLVQEFAYSDSVSSFFFIPTGKWEKIEDQVKEKIANLIIPASLKEKMIGYIHLVGVQIILWMQYHLKYCSLDLNLPNEICWTPQATIDKKKTAEVLVKDVGIDITTRYKLACIYCLEDIIPELWNELPEREKEFLYSEEDPCKVLQMELVVFWRYYIRGEVAKLDDMIRRKENHCCSYTYFFRSAAENGNKAATEYFLQKLNPREKSLINIALSAIDKRCNYLPEITAPQEYYSEVSCFLLSQMSKEQQIEIFITHSSQVLCCFLDWPWQSSFVEMADHLWNFVPQSKYYFILQSIPRKLHFGFKDYNYKELFRDLWLQIPDDDKSYIITNDGITFVLKMLLDVNDEENLKLVFQDKTLIHKNKLIRTLKEHNFLKNMINEDKWDKLAFIVPLLVSSKDEMMEFNKELRKFILRYEVKIYLDKREKLVALLDNIAREYEKRKNVGEVGNTSAKRLCNTEYKDVAHGSKE